MNNLAATLQAQGDLAGAREIQEQVLEISRRILGKEHPSTSIAAWNLYVTLFKLGDSARATTVIQRDLIWLLDRNPAFIGADQRQIREMIGQMGG